MESRIIALQFKHYNLSIIFVELDARTRYKILMCMFDMVNLAFLPVHARPH